MKVVIIGSLSCKDAIINAMNYFSANGIYVTDSISVNDSLDTGCSLLEIDKYYIDKIRTCDLVVAIPKTKVDNAVTECSDGFNLIGYAFGDNTTYELALAETYNKPVVIWDVKK